MMVYVLSLLNTGIHGLYQCCCASHSGHY